MSNENSYSDSSKQSDVNYQPYKEEGCVKNKITYDRASNTMILGIISIVCSITVVFTMVGFVLGIIAIVKGSSVRHESNAGLAGWLLGIISVVLFGMCVIFFLAFVLPSPYLLHSLYY